MTPEERAREIVGALAISLADADGRYFLGLPLKTQGAYLNRAALAESRIAQAIRDAENEALERAAVYLDENQDYSNGVWVVGRDIRSLKSQEN